MTKAKPKESYGSPGPNRIELQVFEVPANEARATVADTPRGVWAGVEAGTSTRCNRQ